MNALVISLRTIHIVAGVLWVGSAIFYLFFVEPPVKALGTAGPKFMQELIERRRYPLYMNSVSILTVLAGAALLWFSSGGFQPAWFASGPGIGFSFGALVAIVVWFIGFLMIRPRAGRMGKIGQEIGRAGGPPSPAQAAEMQTLNRELASIGRVDALLLTVSLVAMATARYWNF